MSLSGWLSFGTVAAAPAVAEFLRKPVNKIQPEAPGEFARLSKGRTHFRWIGPDNGPVALCVHGLTTPSYVFSGVERSLAAMGYRVLTYDLYGRGYSDRPHGAQTPAFFVGQIRELLADQNVTGRLTVVGYSMGAAIAVAFAAEEGRRLHALIFLAPAGITPVYSSLGERLWTAPILGDWLMRVAGGWLLRRELSQSGNPATMVPDLRHRQLAETRIRGFLPAVLSSRRHTLAVPLSHAHRKVRETGTPVLAVWGREDKVIPISTLGRLAEVNPSAHHAELPDAGHDFPQTHPAFLGEELQRFLQP